MSITKNSGIGAASLQQFLRDNPSHRVYDFSQVQAWEQCGQKYAYKYIDKLPNIMGLSAAYSSYVMHPAIAHMFKYGARAFAPLLENDKNPFWVECWANLAKHLEQHNILPSDKEQDLFTIQSAIQAMTELRAYGEDMHLFAGYKYVNHEQLYWSTLPDVPNAVWLSKPDVVLARADGVLAPWETKVSAWQINMDSLPFDRQLLSQAWTTGGGQNIRAFFWFERQYLKRPSMSKKAKPTSTVPGGTTLPGSITWEDVSHDIQLDLSQPLSSRVRIHLNITRNPPDRLLLDEWLVQTQQQVGEMQRAIEAGVYPKRAPKACHDFNHTCEFIDLCPLGVGAKYVADGMAKVNPLEYLGL